MFFSWVACILCQILTETFFQICGRFLGNKQKLQRHILEVHQKLRNHICRLCKQGFTRADKLRRHEKASHDEEELNKVKPIPVKSGIRRAAPPTGDGPQLKILPLGCPDCDLEFEDEEAIMGHMAGQPHNFVTPTEEGGGAEVDKVDADEKDDEEEKGYAETVGPTLVKLEAIEEESETEDNDASIAKDSDDKENEAEEVEEKPEVNIKPVVDVKKDPQGSGGILCPVLTCNRALTTVARLVQHLRVGKHNQPCPECGRVFARVSFRTMALF